jgi:hypothetical protein
MSPKAQKILGSAGVDDLDLPSVGTIKLTESQWMRGAPPPAHRRFGFSGIPSSKTVQPDKKSGISLFSGFRKHKTRPESVDFTGMQRAPPGINYPFLVFEVKGRGGNWI